MKQQWTSQQANEWYDKVGWLRGCNFIGSDCANRIDQWQSYGRDERMKVAERELKLCQEIGMNTIRLIVEFDVWYQERAAFMETLETYIAMADKYGQSVMLVLAHEATICREETYTFKPLGPQTCAQGYHQGRLPLSAEERAKKPAHALERPETRDAYLEMVREIVGRYAKDPRVVCWNVYNEPGISIGDRSVPLLHMLFETVRAQDPIQPLCADVWRALDEDGQLKTEAERCALALSDVISFHSYTPLERMVPQIEALRKLGRPILMTEWLNRINHSEVRELYPLFYLEKIGCYCWGFVVGKTQTHEPWESLWEQYERDPNVPYDFTRWQHDLFRPNLRPYDPHEIELIKHYNALAAKR